MDDFFAIIGFAAFIFAILGPIAFFLTLGARRRLGEAEETIQRLNLRLSALEKAPAAISPQPVAQTPPETVKKPAETQAATEPQPAAVPLADASPDSVAGPSSSPSSSPLPGAPPEAAPAGAPESIAAGAAPFPPKRRRSLEESFGTRWTVWVGGLALALGALLLVRYSIEAGYFGPATRVAFGLLLAVALVAGGEYLRRKDTADKPAEASGVFAVASIPAMLTAAGTVAAFGAIYAAHAVYGFIGAGPAFIALGATGIACMFASALHGPALAGVGLVGAFLAPMLVDSDNPSPWPVVLYLAVLTAAAYGLARLRIWLWLAIAAAAGAALWSLLLLYGILGEDAPHFFPATMLHLIVQAALAGYFLGIQPLRGTPEEDALPEPFSTLGPSIFGILSIFALNSGLFTGQFGTGWVAFAAVMIGLLAVIGFLVAPAAVVLGVAGFLVVAVARMWPGVITPDARAQLPDFASDYFLGPLNPGLFTGFLIVASLAIFCLGAWRLLLARALPSVTQFVYGGAAALTPLAVLILAWLRMTQATTSYSFAAAAAALALVFVAAAAKFRDLDGEGAPPSLKFATGVFASAAIAALALGFTFALDGGVLTVALALAALGAAYVAITLDIPALRWCVAGLGLVIAARLAWEPRVIANPGTTPIFNWLLYGYGVPALAFGYAARMMRRNGGEDTPVRIGQALTILFSAFLVFFEIRHFINNGDAFAATSTTIEQGLLAVASFTFAIVLTRLDASRSTVVFRVASLCFGLLSFAYTVIGLCFIGNPYFSFHGVEGGPIINALLIAYLLPAVLAFVLSIVANGVRPAWYVTIARILTIVLVFLYLTLETRRLFQGPRIGLLRDTSGAEFYSYSAVWLAFGVALLAWGLWRHSREARLASAIFVAVSVLKVFLFDLSGLEGILRALSFIGLGAVLIGIGLVYQKLVFARPASPEENSAVDKPA
jgi:uncharacterized membrane protein